MLRRKIYNDLVAWKQRSGGTTALLIDGARRVGKSFIAKEFAAISLLISEMSRRMCWTSLKMTAPTSICFLPSCPSSSEHSFTTESPSSCLTRCSSSPAHGSLSSTLWRMGATIRLKKNVKDIIIPSEEEHLEMFPLDFEEFLWALGDEVTVPFIRQAFEARKPLGQAVHRKVMNSFRQYLLVGGMPQSVLAYLNGKDFAASDMAKRNILRLYRDDVAKFAEGYEDKVYAVFDGIPGQLSKKEKKYRLSSLGENARFRSYEDSFIWLNEAMVVNTCFNATDPNVGLALSADHATQKCYMADTGLLVTQTFMDKGYTDNELYKAILFDKLDVNEGMILENMVAQMLRCRGHKLYFYSRCDKEHRENHMEVDFLIAEGKKIAPIEVKSGSYRSHASLDKFRAKFSSKIGESYILYTKDVMRSDNILHLPIYMAMFL